MNFKSASSSPTAFGVSSRLPSPGDASFSGASKLAGALSHPLPAGMRDLLPAQAEVQGKLLSCILGEFSVSGYQRVSLPAFEYAAVIEQGLRTTEPSSMIRFVEPETGEVVALRPDMTPQVARMVATRLADAPLPLRLCYRGSVVRRRHERARHDQQVLQAGIELVGAAGLESDLEVILATVRAVELAGLSDYVLDLGHGALAHTLLADCAPGARALLIESLSLKDGAELARRAQQLGLAEAQTQLLLGLLELSGGEEVFEQAEELLGQHSALKYVVELRALFEALKAAGVDSIVVDLAETRSVDYYSGIMFQILAEGPGQAVASGGRYDELYGLFGTRLPAAGAAIQIDDLAWALGERTEVEIPRVLVLSDEDSAAAGEILQQVRRAGVTAAPFSGDSALDYARWWRYSHVARPRPSGGGVELLTLALMADAETLDWSQASEFETSELLKAEHFSE